MLSAVQELCRASYALWRDRAGRSDLHERWTMRVMDVTCVWHFQHAYAGDDELELPLEWMSGAIVSDQDVISKIRARAAARSSTLSR